MPVKVHFLQLVAGTEKDVKFDELYIVGGEPKDIFFYKKVLCALLTFIRAVSIM